jgi:hypothetical protein
MQIAIADQCRDQRQCLQSASEEFMVATNQLTQSESINTVCLCSLHVSIIVGNAVTVTLDANLVARSTPDRDGSIK